MSDPNTTPVFATNWPPGSENTESVADVLNRLLRIAREHNRIPADAAIATAYINAGGFALLADELEQVPRVRLLLGTEPDPTLSQRLVPPIRRDEVSAVVSELDRGEIH